MTQVAISVVTTLYHSAPYIDEFYSRIKCELEKLTDSYEILFVNDGSPDGSLGRVLELHRQDPCVEVIDLSRNFGHHRAMMTASATPWVIWCSCSTAIWKRRRSFSESSASRWRVRGGCHLWGSGAQERKRIQAGTGYLFYKAINWFSRQPIPESPCVARLMTHQYVRALLKHREQALYIEGIMQLTGFDQRPLTVSKPPLAPRRILWQSGWSMW